MAKVNLIQREKWLLPNFIIVSVVTLITGLNIWLFERSGYAAHINAFVHSITSCIWLLIFCFYIFIHFKRTIGSRKLGLYASGLLLTGLLLCSAYSGLALLTTGFQERLSLLHLYSTAIIIVLFLTHVIQNRLALRGQKKAKVNLALIQIKTLFIACLASFLLSLLCWIPSLWEASDQKELYKTVKNYSLSYGKNPFSPSKTTTENQTFIKEHAITDSENCQQCHGDIYQQWQSSIHRYAAADPAYVRNVSLLESKKGIDATRYCEGCHAPSALLSGRLTAGGKHGGTEGTPAFQEGVSCKSCHSIASINSTEGVASYHFSPTSSYPLNYSTSYIATAINELMIEALPQDHKRDFLPADLSTSKFCATCHAQFMDESMNNWGWVKMQDEYTAWLKSPYSGRHDETHSDQNATRCQDCHMPLVTADDPTADSRGKVRSHRFLGANTYVAQHFGEKEQFTQTIDFLQKNKMRISIDEPRRQDSTESRLTVSEELKQHTETPYFVYLGEQIKINILVSNHGVGHDFPGGAIDLNEAWLHLEVLDANNRKVMESGFVQEDKTIEPNAIFYKSIAINRHGKEVWRHDLFNMTGESYRNVIKAGKTDRVEYSLNIPTWAKSPITVFASLKYRKLNRRYSDWVADGKPYKDIPIVDVARSNLSIPVYQEPPMYQNTKK